MEKHIFKLGENSMAIIVPKRWVEKNGLTTASQIFLTENETGSLILSTSETLKTEAALSVDPGVNPISVGRWVGMHYMYGTGKLHIHSETGIKPVQYEAIERKISVECPGFEMISQSTKDIYIEDLTNIKEVDLEKVMTRLHALIDQEFREIREGDPRTIPKIEKLVNRFYMLGMRYVNITQAKDALVYAQALEKIESISDNIEVLAENLKNIRSMPIFESMNELFEICTPALNGDVKSIERAMATRETVINQLQRMRMEPIYKHLIREIADTMTNIAEMGFKRTSIMILKS